MSDITISYKGADIATMDASGTKTLLTEGKYCEDDITVDYVKSGGGGNTYPWVTSIDTETIGANSITNMSQVINYFASRYSNYFLIVLKTTPDTYNQFVGQGSSILRYRNGSIGTAGNGTSYDGKLVEGTQYDIYHY